MFDHNHHRRSDLKETVFWSGATRCPAIEPYSRKFFYCHNRLMIVFDPYPLVIRLFDCLLPYDWVLYVSPVLMYRYKNSLRRIRPTATAVHLPSYWPGSRYGMPYRNFYTPSGEDAKLIQSIQCAAGLGDQSSIWNIPHHITYPFTMRLMLIVDL